MMVLPLRVAADQLQTPVSVFDFLFTAYRKCGIGHKRHLSVFGGHIGEQRIHILGGVRVHIFAESGLPYASCCFLFKQVLVIVFSYHGLLCFFIERMLSVLLL